jgi:hypothetical protein
MPSANWNVKAKRRAKISALPVCFRAHKRQAFSLPEKKAGQPETNLLSKQILLLVRPSFDNVKLMKANYGEISTEKCMAFCPDHNNVF